MVEIFLYTTEMSLGWVKLKVFYRLAEISGGFVETSYNQI